MNRIVFLLLSMVALMTSCIKDVDYSSTDKMKEIVSNCETFRNYTIPIVNDEITVVTLNGDTIAVVDKQMTIQVPKNALMSQTRSLGDNLLSTYFVNKNDPKYEYLKNHTYCAVWQAIMFEDSKNGDYDFNDLVIHVRSMVNTPWEKNKAYQTIDVQAIAMGSQKTIGLGCILSDGSEFILTEDIRKDFFNGEKGFINTENDKEPIRFKLVQTKIVNHELELNQNKAYWTVWYIIVDGDRKQYAVSSDFEYKDYSEVVDKNLLPYGITVANDNGTFSYPFEKMTILSTYPSFKDWVYNAGNGIGKPIKENVYKYCSGGIISPDGTSHKIWDWQDLK